MTVVEVRLREGRWTVLINATPVMVEADQVRAVELGRRIADRLRADRLVVYPQDTCADPVR